MAAPLFGSAAGRGGDLLEASHALWLAFHLVAESVSFSPDCETLTRSATLSSESARKKCKNPS
jgi:hypothetical protein